MSSHKENKYITLINWIIVPIPANSTIQPPLTSAPIFVGELFHTRLIGLDLYHESWFRPAPTESN